MEARTSRGAVAQAPGASARGRLSRFGPGVAAALCGLAPFLLAGLAWQRHEGEIAGAGLIGGCPMLDLVGIPCAACGGARAFFHLTHGDADFLAYNWIWPLAAALVAGYGAVLLARAARGDAVFGVRARSVGRRFATEPLKMAAVTVAILLVPWVVALANADAIRSG